MSLADATRAVGAQPASIEARARVCAELAARGVPAAGACWARTIELAARRGHFFAALTLARRHLQGRARDEALRALAADYGAGRPRGRRPPPTMPPARPVEPPEDPAALTAFAVKLCTDLGGLVPPERAPQPDVPLFSALEPAAFVALAEALTEVPLRSGDVLTAQGAVESALYLLGQGRAEVRQIQPGGAERVLAEVRAPALVGEMSLLTAVPRRATVRADGPGLAWRIDAQTLAALGARQPGLAAQLVELVKARLLSNLVNHSALLRDLPDTASVLGRFSLVEVPAGAEVIAQGAPPPGLFLLLHGAAEVWAHGPNGTARVAQLSEGDAFGEMSLLSGEPTTASVRLPEGGVLLHLPAADFRPHAQEAQAFSRGLEALADIRRGELNDLVEPLEDTFEVVDEAWLVDE